MTEHPPDRPDVRDALARAIRDEVWSWLPTEALRAADAALAHLRTAGLLDDGLRGEVERVVARMGARQVDHRHEDEVGHWGVQGRAYFYAGDIYDDFADLRAALADPQEARRGE
jgi:hypothetical protein